MRTQTLGGSVALIYPEPVCWLFDRNTFVVQDITVHDYEVGGIFTLSSDLGSVTISYQSERTRCEFDLLSALKAVAYEPGTEVTVTGSVVYGDHAADITPFTLKVQYGRTLATRPHCADRVVYFAESSDLWDFYHISLEGGHFGPFPTHPGLNKIDLSSHSGPFSMGVQDGDKAYTVEFRLVTLGGEEGSEGDGEDCGTGEGEDDDNAYGKLKVRYFNTDGAVRTVLFKITQRKRTVGLTDWRANEIVRNSPGAMITAHTDELTLLAPKCVRRAYVDDIMYSPQTFYLNASNEWMPCVITSKSLTLKDWEENDIEITVKTLS